MPTPLIVLPRIDRRIGFLYADRCVVSRDDSAITFLSDKGIVHVPAAMTSCLMLGPGSSITHAAVSLLSESGTSVVWVGDGAGVWYTHGKPIAAGTHLLLAQAKIVSDPALRLEAAKRLYRNRFGDDWDTAVSSITELQLSEGRRMKLEYRSNSIRTGVEWSGKSPRGKPDPINSTLNLANSCLYAICHSILNGLGCSTGLGIVHTGNWRSFTLDVADMYKTKTSIPVSFDLVKEHGGGYVSAKEVRKRMRDIMFDSGFLREVVDDVMWVLGSTSFDDDIFRDVNTWWDGT